MLQVALAQVGVPLVKEHGTPHVPQFSALVCRSTSQPLLSMSPSQLAKPVAHAY